MLATVRRFGWILACFLLLACSGWAQTSALEGDVKGEDGAGVKGALIKIDRTDMKGSYKVKTDKKGHYYYGGLPLGTYTITLEVDGKDKDNIKGVRSHMGDTTVNDFDLQKLKKQQEGLQKAAESGSLSKEQERELSPEAKAAIEKRMKEQQATLAKDKALNEAFNAGKEAMLRKDYQAAIDAFSKAGEMRPNETVVWGNLADAYVQASNTKTGAEQQTLLEKAVESFNKALALKPDDAAFHNNLALAYAKMKKFTEAQAELNKAAQLDPPAAGKYFFNLGAVLTNTGQSEAAGEAFKKAIEADPNYADAHFQYGIYLIGKATTAPDGKIVPPPGTQEEFEKYLQLKPDGRDAEAAKGMIASISGSVETVYKNPSAPAAKKPKKP